MFTKIAQQVIVDQPNIVENVISLPMRYLSKLMLADKRISVDSTKEFSPETLSVVRDLAKRNPNIKFYVGHSPYFDQLKRQATFKGAINPVMSLLTLPTNAIVGLPTQKVSGGDYYNPAANTVVVRSNIPAIAAHEAGHAKDFNTIKYPTLQSLGVMVPFFVPYPEYKASMYAGNYAQRKNLDTHILAPAYGSYLGNAVAPGIGNLPGMAVGHLVKDKDAFKNTDPKYRM